MFIVDLRTHSVLTLALSLDSFIEITDKTSPAKTLMSLVNRARNKPTLLQRMKEILVAGNLPLMDASRLFLRLNGVYKQASIERQAVKRKDLKDKPRPLFFGCDLMLEPEIELLV